MAPSQMTPAKPRAVGAFEVVRHQWNILGYSLVLVLGGTLQLCLLYALPWVSSAGTAWLCC